MNIFLWVLQIFLGALFAFAGVSKFLMPAEEMAKNTPSFLSVGFIYFIAVCEILGAIGLIVPWATKIKPGLTPLAAALLAVIMVGATVVTAIGMPSMAVVPFLVGCLLLIIARGRKGGA